MNVFDSILLGLIQGLTEFIPISSTAHLTLVGKLLGLVDSQTASAWTEFIAVIQMGTLTAVVLYFSRDLFAMAKAVLEDIRTRLAGNFSAALSEQAKMGWLVALGTVPVAVIGLLFSHEIHGWFTKSTTVIIFSLIVLAVLLWIAEKVARHARVMEQISPGDAVIIGSAQALALVPGSSRSGTTITAGLFLGLSRESAARFSFLLSVPAVFASGVYELMKIQGDVTQFGYGNIVIATVVAGASGYAAISWLLKYLSRNSTMVFVWYRLALGLILALFLHFGLIQP